MKIFGKRKKSAVPADTSSDINAVSSNEHVPSYFANAQSSTGGSGSTSSKKKKKQRSATATDQPNGDDIQSLLAMDPSKLNSKQRRLVRRHNEREGNTAAESAESPKDEAKQIASGAVNQPEDDGAKNVCSNNNEDIKKDATAGEATPNETNDESKNATVTEPTQNEEHKAATDDVNTAAEICAKLEGLNSKERRKYLRNLKSSTGGTIDESVIAAAVEQVKKVGERNEKEATNNNDADGNKDSPSKRKMDDEKTSTNTDSAGTTPKKKRKKKKVNLDDLPPDERKRREEQRRMQTEAAERRAAGLVDPNRHPLNSERFVLIYHQLLFVPPLLCLIFSLTRAVGNGKTEGQ